METANNRISFPIVVSLIAGFFTISGGLWHLGYWSTFNFNYFEYVSLTDLFKSSFYPFIDEVWVFAGLIIMPFSSFLLEKYSYPKMGKDITPNEEEKHKKRIRRGQFIIDLIVAVCIVIIGFLISLTSGNFKYNILPILIGFVFVALGLRFKLGDSIIRNYKLRVVILILFSFYPTLNFFIGKSASKEIFEGNKAWIITDFKSNNKLLNKDVIGQPLLGTSSEYHFIYFGGYSVAAIRKDVVENFAISKEYNYRNYNILRSYEERLLLRDSSTLTLDTIKVYYDPALKVHIDSSFRSIVRKKILQ